jgi:hypothetical protein
MTAASGGAPTRTVVDGDAVGDGDAAVVNGVDVDAVATAARGCPAVAELFGGAPAWAATYLPGRRVEGIRVERDAVLLQVIGRWGVPIVDLVAQLRAVVTPWTAGRRVDIALAGLTDPAPPPNRAGGDETTTGM